MKLALYILVAAETANNGRHFISKRESNSMLTVSREKRFLDRFEFWAKRGEQYKPICKESLREKILRVCPEVGKREGTENWSRCGVYEEAREVEEPGRFDDFPLNFGLSSHVGYGEEGREWDYEVNKFGCDFYEECCGEGCVDGEIGQEECF